MIPLQADKQQQQQLGSQLVKEWKFPLPFLFLPLWYQQVIYHLLFCYFYYQVNWLVCLLLQVVSATTIRKELDGPVETKMDLSLPAPWSRNHVQLRQKRMADRYNRRVGSSGRLDAAEWLEKILSSLVADEPFNGADYSGYSEPRVPSGQRIFQREALPSSLHYAQSPSSSGKRRYSLSSVRVLPASSNNNRQLIYPTPNMALIQLENPVRFQNSVIPPEDSGSSAPKHRHQIPKHHSAPIRESEAYPQGQIDSTDYSVEGNSGEVNSSPARREVDVDVYVNYYPYP